MGMRGMNVLHGMTLSWVLLVIHSQTHSSGDALQYVAPSPFRETLGAVNLLEGGVARLGIHGDVGGCCYFRPGACAADPSPTFTRRPNLNTEGSAGMTF